MSLIWVTGAKGFLGRAVSRRFLAAGWTVGALGRSPSGGAPNASEDALAVSNLAGAPAWRDGTVSFSLMEDLANQTGTPDVVVHAAGSGTVGLSLKDPWRDFQNNVDSTACVLEFLRRHAPAARFVYPSSAAVYGSQGQAPLPESAATLPVSPYGYHKSAAELVCRSAFENFGQVTSIVRYFSIYGAGLRKQLVWDIAERIKCRARQLHLGGTGNEIRDFIHVEDAAELAFLVSVQQPSEFTIINGGSGVGSTVRTVASAILKGLAPEMPLSFSGEIRPGDPFYLAADIAKAHSLGFSPKWTLADGLADYVAWYRSQEEISEAVGLS